MKQYSIDYRLANKAKTREGAEPLVELSKYSKGKIIIDIEKTSRSAQKLAKGKCFVRKLVAKKLVGVQSRLPNGFRLKIVDTYRPLSAQRKLWRQVFNEIQGKNPKMSNVEVELETDKWVSNADKIIPIHSTGGTLDLTIVNSRGVELDMGSPINSVTKKSITRAKIPKAARKNRNLLVKMMSAAEFANYKMEWWHWSYGDWGWGLANKKTAIYGSYKKRS